MKKVVITGVSTGIGYSTAKILCDSGYFVYGSVRKDKEGKKLLSEFENNFKPLLFAVTDSKAILANMEKVQSDLKPGESIAGLVNNAGIAIINGVQPKRSFRNV